MRTIVGLAALFVLSCAGGEPAPATPPPAAPAPKPMAEAPKTIRRTVLCFGQVCGSSVTTFEAGGRGHNVYDVHTNGRGPHTDATFELAPDGTLASYESHGHATFGSATKEVFTLAGGRAKWDSQDEHGDKPMNGAAAFVPISSVDLDAFMVQALRAHGGTIALLPGGTARMEKAGEATIDLDGQKKHLVANALTGFWLAPTYIWTEDDGTFFGEGEFSQWIGPEGADAAAAQLIPKQQELTHALDQRISEQLSHKPGAAGVALVHARVLDVEKGAWIPDQTVLIQGDKIAGVGKDLRVPQGAETIDLKGKAVLPGLWDMHAHFSDGDGVMDVASGITSARDVGNKPDTLDDYKKRFDEGRAIGPHLYRAGFIEGRGKDAAHAEVTATNEAEAKAAVAYYAARHYDMIKIYNSVPPEIVPTLTREAHAHGMGVTGHIPAHMLANEAVKAGYDGIEHQNQVMLNFFADHETDTRTLQRFTLVGEKLPDFDLGSAPVKALWALFREHHTVIDPTAATFELTYVAGQGKLPPGTEAEVARLPVQIQRSYFVGGLDLEGKADLYRRAFDKMLASIKAMQDAGVTVVAGTDAIAGITLQRELELFVKAGITPAQALRDATIVPARAMKADTRTGSIAKGKVADLFVVDGDPLANISDAQKTVMTFVAGVRYDAPALCETVGVAAPTH